ncbi:flagellar hook-length control protein FliK [Siminovitchia fortis]|uniref:Flagellar hook-length control protein-like C-terminal domain-containing protein n=1 Tax=Siminovitchia fortis TaxID=254758 RepID=A0A443J141_9BACI|nr:flagellar hook-length control protein FliK [Siminovitchia fortis]RWR14126.1 hypothetical protein D4N35_002870 [Siminovitchia fortis]WHY83304.1 flagellar hook-length control protein FliK [Siminovitchia fortis]
MKLSLLEAPVNFAMANVPEKKIGEGNLLFGEILNMKLQSFRAEPETDTVETGKENTGLMQLLANVLGVMEELQEKVGFALDEGEQELFQETVDLLESIEDIGPPNMAAVLEPVLEKFVLAAEQLQLNSDAEMDSEKLEAALKVLTEMLEQYESISSTFQKSGELLFLAAGQMPGKHNMPIRSDLKPDNGGNQAGKFISYHENTETEEAKQISIRLETANTKEDSAGTASLTEATEKRGAGTGNSQSKADANSIQASSVNRNETEEVIVKIAETAPNERKARELIRQFSNVLQKSHFNQGLQTKSMTIRLYPEHLGSLRIELTQRNGAMIARILASTSMAKDLLDSQIHQLRQAFVQQNIQVDKVDISYQEGLDKYSSQDQRNGDQEQAGPDQRSDKEAFNGEKDEEEFSSFLQNILFEMEV